MSYDRRHLILTFGASLLGACGFSPLYDEDSSASAVQGRIEVSKINGRIGFQLKERLSSRLGAPEKTSHRLEVKVSVASTALAISSENEITRYSLTGTATYVLKDVRDNTVNDQGNVRAFASYSATASTFATSAASVDANERLAHSLAEQIATRIAASSNGWLR